METRSVNIQEWAAPAITGLLGAGFLLGSKWVKGFTTAALPVHWLFDGVRPHTWVELTLSEESFRASNAPMQGEITNRLSKALGEAERVGLTVVGNPTTRRTWLGKMPAGVPEILSVPVPLVQNGQEALFCYDGHLVHATLLKPPTEQSVERLLWEHVIEGKPI